MLLIVEIKMIIRTRRKFCWQRRWLIVLKAARVKTTERTTQKIHDARKIVLWQFKYTV